MANTAGTCNKQEYVLVSVSEASPEFVLFSLRYVIVLVFGCSILQLRLRSLTMDLKSGTTGDQNHLNLLEESDPIELWFNAHIADILSQVLLPIKQQRR